MVAKALHKFFSAQVPQNFKEVQAVHGQLNYLVYFAPVIAHDIAPIRALLSRKGSQVWDASCTRVLMHCAEHAARWLQLGITRVGHPVHQCGARACVALGCQIWDGVGVPTLIMAWDLMATEAALSEVERILSLTHCFCRKFQGMLLNTPITCFLPDRAHLLFMHDWDCTLNV